MLEIRKSAVSLDERDLMDLERIISDSDEKEAISLPCGVSVIKYIYRG